MEHSKYHLKGRTILLFVHTCRDASSVILYSDGIIFIYAYFDSVAVAGERLVDTVVDHLIYEMMETSFSNVSNIHRRSFSYRLKSFKYLNTIGGVLL